MGSASPPRKSHHRYSPHIAHSEPKIATFFFRRTHVREVGWMTLPFSILCANFLGLSTAHPAFFPVRAEAFRYSLGFIFQSFFPFSSFSSSFYPILSRFQPVSTIFHGVSIAVTRFSPIISCPLILALPALGFPENFLRPPVTGP